MAEETSWEKYLVENSNALSSIAQLDLEKLLQVLVSVRKNNGCVWILGNGGSASLAAHAVADFSKTAKSMGGSPLRALAPSEMTSLQSAYSNDESFEMGFARTLETYLDPQDAVIVISVSGKSPNLLRAIDVAKTKAATVCAIVGAGGVGLRDQCQSFVLIESNDYQVVENMQLSIVHWLTKNL